MIPEIKKILYTSDLSETSNFAFSYAASLANRYDAKANTEAWVAGTYAKNAANDLNIHNSMLYVENATTPL